VICCMNTWLNVKDSEKLKGGLQTSFSLESHP
jgi:hypothetical protein